MRFLTSFPQRVLPIVAMVALVAAGPLFGRTWTNLSGTVIEAELTGVEGDIALLEKDGQVFRVPIASLSPEDRAFLEAWEPPSVSDGDAVSIEVPKKGFCLSQKKYTDWPEKLQTLRAGWFYSWKAEYPEGIPEGVQYVPMVFGKANRLDASVDYLKTSKSMLGYDHVLGFNEPDKTDQANMSVEDALKHWPRLMDLGVPLISPAAANADGEWMEQFMEGVEQLGYRVDYVAIHSYGGSNPDAFLDMLERVHRKFDRPLWITEFAVGDWNAKDVSENRHDVRDIKAFMRRVLPKLDRLDYVFRYAWFSADVSDAHLGTSALFNEDGSLTDLGEYYSKH